MAMHLSSSEWAFGALEEAEQAYRELQMAGYRPDQISLDVREDCPLCSRDDPAVAKMVVAGQAAGVLLGFVIGMLTILSPSASPATGAGWVTWALKATVVLSWSLAGGILGSMLGAALSEAVPSVRQRRQGLVHVHYTLRVEGEPEAAERILSGR